MSKTYAISVPDGTLQKLFDDLAQKHILSTTVCLAMQNHQSKMKDIYQPSAQDKPKTLTIADLEAMSLRQIDELPEVQLSQALGTIIEAKAYYGLRIAKYKGDNLDMSRFERKALREGLVRLIVVKQNASEDQYQAWLKESEEWPSGIQN